MPKTHRRTFSMRDLLARRYARKAAAGFQSELVARLEGAIGGFRETDDDQADADAVMKRVTNVLKQVDLSEYADRMAVALVHAKMLALAVETPEEVEEYAETFQP